MTKLCVVLGAVPLKVLVIGLKLSHAGSGWPFACVAAYVRVSPCGSRNVPAGKASDTGRPVSQVCAAVCVSRTGGEAGAGRDAGAAPVMVADSDCQSPQYSPLNARTSSVSVVWVEPATSETNPSEDAVSAD